MHSTTATTPPRRRRRKNWTQMARRTVQTGFVLFIIGASLRHNLFEETTTAASIDALCPFGGLETLWRTLIQGEYVPKTHPSNLVLGLGLLLGALVSGGAFCGWICPFGTLQDGLTWLRTRLHLPEVTVPKRLDSWLRYGRFVSLALVLYMTISTAKLWFASYDPYRTLFGLGWIFEFNMAEQWPAYAVAIGILLLSFAIPRFWCKYTCPLGGALSLVGHFSLLRIRRSDSNCAGCALCDVACPVGIDVMAANPAVSTDCIGCLACVDACPRHGALEVQFAPTTWYDSFRRAAIGLFRPASRKGGAA